MIPFMEKKTTLYIIMVTQNTDRKSARIHNGILTVVSSGMGNGDLVCLYKMELALINKNSQSEVRKEEKTFIQVNSLKTMEMQPLVETKSGLYTDKGQDAFCRESSTLVLDFIHFYSNGGSELHSSDWSKWHGTDWLESCMLIGHCEAPLIGWYRCK